TMSEAISMLNERETEGIYVACTHPVLVEDALDKIKEAGADEVVGTDTIESEVSSVSVAPVVANAIG
ncbi:MAG: ribose-phosphate pyrophosphokinase, partial [Candidatus Aenigmatarchaeota archaeon]